MHTELETVRAALARNDLDAARAALGELIRSAPAVHDPAHHLALAAAAEEAGEWRWAESAYNLVLRDDSTHPEALARLAALAEEQGDLERAAIQRERLAESRPGEAENLLALRSLYHRLGWAEQRSRIDTALSELGVRLEDEPPPAAAEPAAGTGAAPAGSGVQPDLELIINPSDADLARFLALFSGREDVHARQWFIPRKGISGYSPVEEPLTARHLRQHFFGDVTLGVYPIRLDGTCLFFALDLDLTRAAMDYARRGTEEAAKVRSDLRRSAEHVLKTSRELGLDPLVEDSGYKGRHFWFFLAQPERADLLFGLGKLLLRLLEADLPGGVALEFFPRQARRRGKGYGNLIKLPLGIHRRTGRRAWILDGEGNPHPHPFRRLAEARRLSHAQLLELADRLSERLGAPSPAVPPPWEDGPAGEPAPAPAPSHPEVEVPPPPDWTEAEFSRHPAVSHLLAHCPVLAELVRRALEERRLDHDEQIVIVHILGHVPGGVAAANYLLRRAIGVPPDRFLKSPLRGHPISCPKIRQRLPGLTSRQPCHCEFPFAPDHYPTPVLHLRTLPDEAPAPQPAGDAPDPADLARRYLALAARIEELKGELVQLERAAAAALRTAGGGVDLDGGRLTLEVTDGVEHLRWIPAGEDPGDHGNGPGGTP